MGPGGELDPKLFPSTGHGTAHDGFDGEPAAEVQREHGVAEGEADEKRDIVERMRTLGYLD